MISYENAQILNDVFGIQNWICAYSIDMIYFVRKRKNYYYFV